MTNMNSSLCCDEPLFGAQKILATFLKRPQEKISCELLGGGSPESTLVKCIYLEDNYVVKFFSNSEFGKNEIAWTHHASQLSIGPTLYHADLNGNYMIIEFAQGNPLVPAIANSTSIIKSVAESLKRLHQSSASFGIVSNIFDRIEKKYAKLHCSGQLKDVIEKCLSNVKKIKELLKGLTVFPVPCHNDLSPGNIFVHNRKVTLIDWGDAGLGNPYYDVAAFFILNSIKPDYEKIFFEQYDANVLNSQWQIYMHLYKQLVYFEFALNLLLGVQANKSDFLLMKHIVQGNNLDHYLALLAERTVEIDTIFLYNMAIASINKINLDYY